MLKPRPQAVKTRRTAHKLTGLPLFTYMNTNTMTWTISIAGLLSELEGSPEEKSKLTKLITKYSNYGCGPIVPERSRHFSAFAICQYPEQVTRHDFAEIDFQKLKDAVAPKFASESLPKFQLQLQQIEGKDHGIFFRFRSNELEALRDKVRKIITPHYKRLEAEAKWTSLLDHQKKNFGDDVVASIMRHPTEPSQELRWTDTDFLPPTLTCTKLRLVLSDPFLTNPYEREEAHLDLPFLP